MIPELCLHDPAWIADINLEAQCLKFRDKLPPGKETDIAAAAGRGIERLGPGRLFEISARAIYFAQCSLGLLLVGEEYMRGAVHVVGPEFVLMVLVITARGIGIYDDPVLNLFFYEPRYEYLLLRFLYDVLRLLFAMEAVSYGLFVEELLNDQVVQELLPIVGHQGLIIRRQFGYPVIYLF